MSHPVVHWEIGGRNMAALKEFYAKAFGWTFTEAGPDYTLVQPVDGGTGGGLMQTSGDTPPYVTVYVAVADLQATLDHLKDLGGIPVVPPTVINESMSFALFRDPEGNVVGLLEETAPGTA